MRPALDGSRRRTPVSSSTLRCFEIAGFDTPKPAGRLRDGRGARREVLDDAPANRVGEGSEWIVNHNVNHNTS